MEKPISIRITELKSDLVGAINKANLPGSILQLVVGEVSRQVDDLARNEYVQETEAYKKSQEEETKVQDA